MFRTFRGRFLGTGRAGEELDENASNNDVCRYVEGDFGALRGIVDVDGMRE